VSQSARSVSVRESRSGRAAPVGASPFRLIQATGIRWGFVSGPTNSPSTSERGMWLLKAPNQGPILLAVCAGRLIYLIVRDTIHQVDTTG
jgi:hypothetical protein